jgi:hypothetical protein
MKRPTCVHCGKAYGQRWTKPTVLAWKDGESRPPYRGNGIVVKEADWAALSDIEKTLGRPKQDGDRYVRLDVWDGETWFGGQSPFCTLRCALNYARHAYAQQQAYREQAEHDAKTWKGGR